MYTVFLIFFFIHNFLLTKKSIWGIVKLETLNEFLKKRFQMKSDIHVTFHTKCFVHNTLPEMLPVLPEICCTSS